MTWSQCKISFLGEIWGTTGLNSFILVCKLIKAVLKSRTSRKKTNKSVKNSLCSMLCLKKKKKKFFEDIKKNSSDKSELRFPEVFGRVLP